MEMTAPQRVISTLDGQVCVLPIQLLLSLLSTS